jgi:hypothetical protein
VVEAKCEYLCLDLIEHRVRLLERHNFWNVDAKFTQCRYSIPEGILKVPLQEFVTTSQSEGRELGLLLDERELRSRQ